MQSVPQFEGAEVMTGIGALFALVIALVSVVIGIIVWWKIFSKVGWSGALGLLMLVPIVNLVMIFVLAFGTWPIERELEQLRAARSQSAGGPAQPPLA